MLDWNPAGHEPDHVYTLPHFDFHFYKITPAQVMAMMPSDPQWNTKAASLPAANFVPAGYQAAHVLANIPAGAAAVPMMGLHWLDVRRRNCSHHRPTRRSPKRSSTARMTARSSSSSR
jgi:hypothetical protein